MGFIDALKKIFSVEEEVQPEPEKVSFSDIDSWIENRKNSTKTEEKEIIDSIKSKISETVSELDGKIGELEKIDVDSMRSMDKLKKIVKDNLIIYVSHARKFTEDLSRLDGESFEEFIEKANKIFSDFDQKSYISYEKTTILIGKQMAGIKLNMVNISKHIKEVSENNKKLLDSSRLVFYIESELKKVSDNQEILDSVGKRIMSLDSKVKDIEDVNKKTSKDIEEIKKSEEYIKNSKRKEEIELVRGEIEKEISGLNKMVDLKALGNEFHAEKEKIALINSYRENFLKTFGKDDGEGVLSLVLKSKLDSKDIFEKIGEIKDKKNELDIKEKAVVIDATELLSSEIEKKVLDINKLNVEREKELKSKGRIEAKKEEAILSIKRKLSEFDIVVG